MATPGVFETGHSEKGANLVTFSGAEDITNPRNWTLGKKWLVVTTVSLFAFIAPVSSTMIAPSLTQINADFNIHNGEASSTLMLSIFVLGYVIGPLVTSPLSEVYGRVIVLQIGNLSFLVFNLVCGFAQTQAQLTVFRLIAGIGGSTSLGVGGGIIGDCFVPEQRGLAVSIYNLMPLLGPAIGPIVGAFITEYSTWRWSFWATSIADAFIQSAGLIFLQESWAPLILQRKKQRLIQDTGNQELFTAHDNDEHGSVLSRMRLAFVRPVKLLATQVIIQALCLYLAYLFGVTFLVLATFTSLWTERYGYSLGIGSLNYIALAVGYTFGTQVSARVNDKIYKRLKKQNNNKGIPEYRLPMLALGAFAMPVGLLIYAWTAQYKIHWIVVDIGVAIYAAGTFTCFQCLQTYLLDAYTFYAASAFAAATILRSIFGAVFPLFASKLYQSLGHGWGTTTLALIAIVIGWPAPVLLWKFGPALRARSPYAAEPL